MFKEENRVWWYLVGVIIMMVLLLVVGNDYILPAFRGERDLFERTKFSYSEAPKFDLDGSSNYLAEFTTNKGIIVVDLYEQFAPNNVNNFVFLTREGYYDGTLFHRLIPGLLIQGGDRNSLDNNPDNDGQGNPGYFVDDEINWDSLDLDQAKRNRLESAGYKSTPGLESQPLRRLSLAMASDLSRPDVNGSQFFFVIADSNDPRLEDLNGFFTVVGTVVSGVDVLNTLANEPVDDPSNGSPRPLNLLRIDRVKIIAR